MNCQTKLRINHLTAVKSVAILEKIEGEESCRCLESPPAVTNWKGRVRPSGCVGTHHPFRWGKETHSPNSICCKQQQGRCKNYSCNLRDRRPPITPPLFQINKTKKNETQKFQLSKCKYKIALASAHPTQEKFIDENVHIKVQKKNSNRLFFHSTGTSRTPDSQTPGSRTAVHVLMEEKRKKMSGAS
ncbi:hypothetical protein TNCV_3791711 [Trichonephila clavipes]|nr:hypothetical protein TNCV_3791711 [Trichonephila clavipes]